MQSKPAPMAGPTKTPEPPLDPLKWWDTKLLDKPTLDAFLNHLGEANAPSRVAAHQTAQALNIRTMLDVGCGPALDHWFETGIAWRGVDGSDVLVNYCREKGVEIDHAQADALPYGDRSFDLVYSRHLWEHLLHYAGALKEACRIADRAVMIVFFRPPGLEEKVQVLWGAHYNDYSIAKIRAAFEVEWPGCKISSAVVTSPKYTKVGGELILLVERAP